MIRFVTYNQKQKQKKLGVTLCNVDPKALVFTLAATLQDEKVDTWANTRWGQ